MSGGYKDGDYLSSTEIYEAGQWTEVGALPAAVEGVSGASVQNTVYMLGKRDRPWSLGYVTDTDDALLGGSDGSSDRHDIWKYDAETQQWERVGKMSEARGYHAVATVPNQDLAKYCNN